MTTTVGYYLPEFTQGTLGEDSGMKLKLSKPSDRSAVNGSGDALLWAGQGWLTAVVGETWTESLAASVEDASGLIPRAGWLGVGSTVVSDVRAELDPASVSAVQAGLATSTSVSTLQTAVDAITAIFTGMTSLPNWLRRAFRKDSGTAGMTTAQTEINNTGGAFTGTTDSLEAIRDNSGGASLEDIISGVQSVSGAIVEAQNSATLSIRIGDTWTQDIGSLGDLTGKVVTFAMKKRASDADTAAIVFITEGTGLTRLNGASTTAGWGSITINDEVAGDITLRLESDATSLLTSGSYVDAVKLLEDGDDRSPRNAGRTVVSAGVIADIT